MATFSFLRRTTVFFAGAGLLRALDFAFFCFAANASPRRNWERSFAGLSERKDYKVFSGRTGSQPVGFHIGSPIQKQVPVSTGRKLCRRQLFAAAGQ
jgi:hypothetical protein